MVNPPTIRPDFTPVSVAVLKSVVGETVAPYKFAPVKLQLPEKTDPVKSAPDKSAEIIDKLEYVVPLPTTTIVISDTVVSA